MECAIFRISEREPGDSPLVCRECANHYVINHRRACAHKGNLHCVWWNRYLSFTEPLVKDINNLNFEEYFMQPCASYRAAET